MWNVRPKPGSPTRVLLEISVYRADRISAETAHGGGFLTVVSDSVAVLHVAMNWIWLKNVCGLKYLTLITLICLSATTILRLTQLRTHLSCIWATYSMYRQHIMFVSFVWGTSMYLYLTGNLECLLPFLSTTINWSLKPFSPSSFYSAYFSIIFIETQATCLTFRHRSFSMQDRRFASLQRTLFMYLINKYISLSDICLTVHHWYK